MALSKSELRRRAKKIRLFAMDVDGVLTEGSIILLESGEEIKFWNVKDRIGFFMLRKLSERFYLAWITGRKSRQVSDRAAEIGLDALVQGSEDKGGDLRKVLKKLGLKPEEALFIGDDLIDLPALALAGLSVCPADAHAEVKKRCDYVSPIPGGRGVLREMVDLVLASRGLLGGLVELYLKGEKAGGRNVKR